VTERVMLVNMGNGPHCDYGEGLPALRAAPYPLLIFRNPYPGLTPGSRPGLFTAAPLGLDKRFATETSYPVTS
jgi:hypothetical protein